MARRPKSTDDQAFEEALKNLKPDPDEEQFYRELRRRPPTTTRIIHWFGTSFALICFCIAVYFITTTSPPIQVDFVLVGIGPFVWFICWRLTTPR